MILVQDKEAVLKQMEELENSLIFHEEHLRAFYDRRARLLMAPAKNPAQDAGIKAAIEDVENSIRLFEEDTVRVKNLLDTVTAKWVEFFVGHQQTNERSLLPKQGARVLQLKNKNH